MSTSTALWTFQLFSVWIILKFLIHFIKIQEKIDLTNVTELKIFLYNLEIFMKKAFSYAYIVDSRYVGLCLFLLSNIFTGLIKILIPVDIFTNFYAFLIICFNSLICRFIPFFAFYYFNKNELN